MRAAACATTLAKCSSRAQERLGFTLSERDIEQDDRLLAAYLERIPVVTIDGAEVFEFFVDEARLEQALATPRRRRSASVE